MRVVTVLKSGGEYRPEHVARLARQLRHFHPGAELVCLTDFQAAAIWETAPGIDVVPLAHNWPGWWSKMELYGPTIAGDVFYMDLDSTVVGPLDSLVTVTRSTVLSDFYKPALPGSGLLYLKEADRPAIFDYFASSAARIMTTYRTRDRWGDQGVLCDFPSLFDRWQEVRPGLIVSYKCDIRHNKDELPQGAALVCYHGQPRPWFITETWSPHK